MNIERLDLLKDMYYHPTLGGEYLQPPTEYEMRITQKLNEIIDKLNQKEDEIDQLTNNWNELRQHIKEYLEEWQNSDDEWVKGKCDMARDILYDMKEIKENNNVSSRD